MLAVLLFFAAIIFETAFVTAVPRHQLTTMAKALHKRVDEAPAADGSPGSGRVIYGSIAAVSFAILIVCLVQRVRTLRVERIKDMNVVRILVFVIYVLGLCFVLSGLILQLGVGLTDLNRCKAAIYLCLVFYVGGKVVSYAFLCERLYALRATRHRRYQDPLYLVSMAIVILGFGTIAVFAFIKPVYEISPEDGKCRIGLPFEITLPLLIYDVMMNIGMTILFIILVFPYLKQNGWRSYVPSYIARAYRRLKRLRNARMSEPKPVEASLDPVGKLERLIWKSLIASVAILISTVVNLAILFKLHGREQGWFCFTLCTVDVTWTIVVIHLLTKSPEELDSEPRKETGGISRQSGFSISGKDANELKHQQSSD